MPRQDYVGTLIACQVSGTALNTSISATSIIPGAAKYTLETNFWDIGRALRITASGRMSNIATSPGTFTPDVRMGGAIVFNGGAVSLNAVAKTNVGWWLDVLLTCQAIGTGTSTTLLGQGKFISESVVGAASGTTITASLPAFAPAVGAGVDCTAALAVDLFGTFSVSNANNSVQVHQYVLESLN